MNGARKGSPARARLRDAAECLSAEVKKATGGDEVQVHGTLHGLHDASFGGEQSAVSLAGQLLAVGGQVGGDEPAIADESAVGELWLHLADVPATAGSGRDGAGGVGSVEGAGDGGTETEEVAFVPAAGHAGVADAVEGPSVLGKDGVGRDLGASEEAHVGRESAGVDVSE